MGTSPSELEERRGKSLQPIWTWILSWDEVIAQIPSQWFAMMGIACFHQRIPVNFSLQAFGLPGVPVEESHPAGFQRGGCHGCLGPPR